ncbi:D-alanyl-D-alanine carboxypeptidase family protein [Lentilactobacillus parafarraginis]|uniref:D-alanyl-D-alanine carboxypeptidase family protein n=1 Tax=Lentilactobacillus parafarraginis TaxID=390842 RepID=UPI001CDC7874|nr:serine hydrolase [Lentilactobacillus parafarraginis]
MREKSLLKKLTTWGLIAIGGLAIFLPFGTAQAKAKQPQYKFEAKEIYVTDAKTGQTIYQKNGNTKRPIASLSKLMTLYLTKQAIDQHHLSWNQKVPVSKPLIKMSKSYELGTFKIKKSKQYTVKQLYQAALIASSNSAASALGEAVANGNNTKFISMMNAQAKQWHINAHFVSSSGLDNTDLTKYHLQVPGTGKKAQNMVSAKAISTVAAKVLGEFPQITKWSSQPSMKVGNQVLVNSNRLLKGDVFYKKSARVDGLKTGFTDTAGLCLTVSFWHQGRHLIATIIDSNTIFSSMAKLVQAIEKNYVSHAVTVRDHRLAVGKHTITAVPQQAKTVVWYRKGTQTPAVAVRYQDTVNATSVAKNQQVGSALIQLKGQNQTATVPMLAASTVKAPVKHKKAAHHQSLFAKISETLVGIVTGFLKIIGNFIKHF